MNARTLRNITLTIALVFAAVFGLAYNLEWHPMVTGLSRDITIGALLAALVCHIVHGGWRRLRTVALGAATIVILWAIGAGLWGSGLYNGKKLTPTGKTVDDPPAEEAEKEDPYEGSWTVVEDPSTLSRDPDDEDLTARKFLKANPAGTKKRYPAGRMSTKNWFHTGNQEIVFDLLVQAGSGPREVMIIKTSSNQFGLVRKEGDTYRCVEPLTPAEKDLIFSHMLEIGVHPVGKDDKLDNVWIAIDAKQ